MSRSSLFMHAGILEFLPDFLFVGMPCSWAWRRWSLNMSHISWAPLPFRALSNGTLLSRSLKGLESALLKSRVVSLLHTLLAALRILNSIISWPLQPRLPLSFTFPTSPSLLVGTKPSITPLLLGSALVFWRLKYRLKKVWFSPVGRKQEWWMNVYAISVMYSPQGWCVGQSKVTRLLFCRRNSALCYFSFRCRVIPW